MRKHRWEKEEVTEYGTKRHICVKCGIRKHWRGGDYQSWEYYWCETFVMTKGGEDWRIIETWERPECIERNILQKPTNNEKK